MGVKLTIEQIRLEFEKNGYQLLSTHYENRRCKLSYICPNEHRGQTSWSLFKKGCRCPVCKTEGEKCKFEDVKNFLEQRGFKLLSTQYENYFSKLEYECPKGHRGQKSWYCFLRGLKCPKCRGRNKTIDEIKEAFKERGYILLSPVFEYSFSKLQYICSAGHKGKISWDNFKQGHGCSTCIYKGERELGRILEQIFPGKVQHLDNLGFLGPQKVDYSVRDLCLAFEYDGEQHFRPTRFKGVSVRQAKQNFKIQQERDIRKNSLCKENGYNLIRIAYYKNLSCEMIEGEIDKYLKQEVVNE